MPSALVPRGHCYAQSATFKKVDKTIAQSKCEHSAQPFDKSKFEIADAHYILRALAFV